MNVNKLAVCAGDGFVPKASSGQAVPPYKDCQAEFVEALLSCKVMFQAMAKV
jgi:hypothetical protein